MLSFELVQNPFMSSRHKNRVCRCKADAEQQPEQTQSPPQELRTSKDLLISLQPELGASGTKDLMQENAKLCHPAWLLLPKIAFYCKGKERWYLPGLPGEQTGPKRDEGWTGGEGDGMVVGMLGRRESREAGRWIAVPAP